MPGHNGLISSAELADILGQADLRLFDCTTYLEPAPEGSNEPYLAVPGRHTFEVGHIPGADFLDLQGEFSDPDTRLRFMMPDVAHLERAFGRHGVSDQSRVVLYSIGTPMWATRFWWMLTSLGFENVAVLDGGTAKWKNEGRPLKYEPAQPSSKGNFVARAERRELLASGAEVEQAMKTKSKQIVDARTADFYLGQSKKDYVYAKGHIPGAKNVSHTDLADSKSRAFKSRDELKKMLADAGLAPADAARASYLLIVYVFGSIALEVADVHEPGPLPTEAERIAGRQVAFAATPPDAFPRSAAAATTMAGYISTEQYLWGLHRILDGLVTRGVA